MFWLMCCCEVVTLCSSLKGHLPPPAHHGYLIIKPRGAAHGCLPFKCNKKEAPMASRPDDFVFGRTAEKKLQQ